MKSSALQAVLWVLLIFCTPLFAQSPNRSVKKPVSSIGGKVTLKGKGIPGIIVLLRSDPTDQRTAAFTAAVTAAYKDTTDQDGEYRIKNVPAGTYQVSPAAPALVLTGEPAGKTLIVTEGETVDDIDFAMARGGVITGKATDSEDRPLIEEQITLLPVDASNQGGHFIGGQGRVQTDDRGIYRIFGIPQGRYKVALGQSEDGSPSGGARRSQYLQTFHPAVTDSSKAVVIEVTEGSEVPNVDIKIGRTLPTFAVSGRIVNGENQQPLANVRLSLRRLDRGGSGNNSSASNSAGEFKLEGVRPGKYALVVFARQLTNSDMRADEVPFDLIDQDVTGLVVKTSRGASISGVIVLEGTNDKLALAGLSQLLVHTYVTNDGPGSWVPPANVNPDGSFRVGGLQSGMVNFSLGALNRSAPREFTIVRVEHDGVALGRTVQVRDGDHLTGILLVLNYGNGTIRGRVRVEGGEVPSTARFNVWITTPEGGQQNVRSPQVDSRGHFVIEALAPGRYELNAGVVIPGSRSRPTTATQQVNVENGAVAEVTLTVHLVPTPDPGNP